MQPPQEIYEKVPEEHRDSVKWAIAGKAWETAKSEASEKFGVIIGSAEGDLAWTNNCGKGVIVFDSDSERRREWVCRKFSADGRLIQIGSQDTFEEFKWRNRRRDELILAYWNDPKIVSEAISNSVANTERRARSFRARGSLLGLLSRQAKPLEDKQLEERIPLEEALSLAKDGKGKGFYQLALRYALGDEVPMNGKTAYQMLVKACESNYANAVLIEGICDESNLKDHHSRSFTQQMLEYCRTTNFDDGRRESDSLTNEVAFARVMGKYERAKELGALAATNQIAALNKRLSDFRTEESEEKEKVERAKEKDRRVKEKDDRKKENDRRVKEMLGEDAAKADENHPVQFKANEKQFDVSFHDAGVIQAEIATARTRQSLRGLLNQNERKSTTEQQQMTKSVSVKTGPYESAFEDLVGLAIGQQVCPDSELGFGTKSVELKHPYRYFKDCELLYADGCLYGAMLQFKSAEKYSEKSLVEEARAVSEDIARRFGITYSEKFHPFWTGEIGTFKACAWTNRWLFCVSGGADDDERMRIEIQDIALAEKLRRRHREREEAQRAVLPVFEECKQQ